ncbi:MAG: flagellar export protein FliJ [Bdellovibrionales bacterium]|nr:flagellar export protein FliJ [Bdellovibrionales bacterium]
MKKFKFRLAVLEKHRKQQEQERQVWLSKCLARLRATEAKLLDLDMKEVQARREFAALGEGRGGNPVKPESFWMLDRFIEGQKVRRVELKQELEQDERELAAAYAEFIRARQQRKIMEKLREKSHERFLEKAKKQEARQTDELYTMRHRLVTDLSISEDTLEEEPHEA